MTSDAPLPAAQTDRAGEAARQRAAAFVRYDLDQPGDDDAFADITRFAARLCEVPTALVNVLDADTQWTLTHTGADLGPLPRTRSLCEQTVLGDTLLEVPDLAADPRFAAHPLVADAPHLRFYAGAPLVTPEGERIGAVCVIDTQPHPQGLTAMQRDGLTLMAALVMERLGDRRVAARQARQARALAQSEERFRTLADTMPQMVWSTLPDGYHDYYNARWYEFTGMPDGSTDGEEWNGMFHPDDQERAWARWRHSLETGEPYEIEYRLRHFDGAYRWVLGRALPIRDEAGAIVRWFGTCTDIHEQKVAAEEREIISHELAHRIKNIFAVIAGLVSFAARARPEFAPAAADLRARITALGRAHDFVRPHSPASRSAVRQDSLHALLGELFSPYQVADAERVVVEGDDVAIDDRSATPIALLFHELATNASKYGALSRDTGQVRVAITRAGERVDIHWIERGGPAVSEQPDHHGFGSQLIELSAIRQLGGAIDRRWDEDGLSLALTVPAASLIR